MRIYPKNLGFSTSYTLASDAVQGAYSVTLTAAPSGISPGSIVTIDENATNDPEAYLNGNITSSGNRAAGSLTWFVRSSSRWAIQNVEVVSVTGNVVTFDTPIEYPFHTSSTCSGCASPADHPQ